VNVTTSRLLLTTDAIGGVWQYSIDLAQALASRGVHVLLTVLGPVPTAAQRLEASTLAGVKLIETGLPLDWLCDGPGPVRAAATAIADIAHAECADLVQLNAPTLAAYSHFPAPVVAVTHGCVGTWWQAARQQPLAQNYHWHRDAMKQGLAAADRVVAPTASYAATVARYYRMAEAPLVVSNGREPGATPRCAALHDCALTVGRLWDQVKNAAMLDRVAARMAIPFYAAGAVTGPHGETAELDNLHALGQLDSAAMARQFAARPVFVSAATFEPFGLAVLEAAGAGCALILSDIPTFRELWNGIAIFVPPDDESAYTDAIDMVIGNPALRQRMGEAARERAIHFTPTRTAEAMLRIYASTLRDHLPRNRAAA
jgi:glycosyltransferase involved in cell wall biosynthesis